MDETALKAALMHALRSAFPEALFWRAGAGPYSGASGVPDILGCVQGFFVGIEVKHPDFDDPGEHLTPNQIGFGLKIQKAGGIYIVTNRVEDALYQVKTLLRAQGD